ncbi:MAG: hypothetical protein OEV14_02190 [Gammaproteobacteria bacterium]|nr:hypothetical protein [Gammaproteobacteria bacterium]
MTIYRPLLASLICAVPLLMAGCSMPRVAMPHVMGLGTYYEVTDDATGRIYYTDNLRRESRGVIEFEDPASGALISLAAASAREISKDEYRRNRSQ